jgi:nucleoside-diphosphate-sugar epimerase
VGKLYHLRDDREVTWKRYLADLGAMIGKHPRGNLPFPLAWGMGWLMDKLCAPLRLRPPLTRLAVAVMGRNNEEDASPARMDLGWKSRVSYKEAMERIAGWVSEHYS